jgi:hypothetical protein
MAESVLIHLVRLLYSAFDDYVGWMAWFHYTRVDFGFGSHHTAVLFPRQPIAVQFDTHFSFYIRLPLASDE